MNATWGTPASVGGTVSTSMTTAYLRPLVSMAWRLSEGRAGARVPGGTERNSAAVGCSLGLGAGGGGHTGRCQPECCSTARRALGACLPFSFPGPPLALMGSPVNTLATHCPGGRAIASVTRSVMSLCLPGISLTAHSKSGQRPCEVGTMTIPISWMRKQRHGDIK